MTCYSKLCVLLCVSWTHFEVLLCCQVALWVVEEWGRWWDHSTLLLLMAHVSDCRSVSHPLPSFLFFSNPWDYHMCVIIHDGCFICFCVCRPDSTFLPVWRNYTCVPAPDGQLNHIFLMTNYLSGSLISVSASIKPLVTFQFSSLWNIKSLVLL